jgi:hypothetical protein
MINRILAALTALAIITFAASAYAADTTSVVIPWGDWLSSLLTAVASVLVALLSFIVSKFAPTLLKTFLTNDLIAKSVNYGLGAVEGAVAGKTLTLATTNAVLAAAEQYAVASAPTISAWVGANLRPLILAKLSAFGVVPAEASATSVGAAI